MTRMISRLIPSVLFGAIALASSTPVPAQSANGATPSAVSSVQSSPTSQSAAYAQARRRAARRRQRALQKQQRAAQPAQPDTGQVAPTADQRQRDAQILAAQKAQSAETARENDAVTQKAVRDQQQQQAEPRIQDAPGAGSQPLPGEPAVQPTQPADPPRIQDAPGPAQTLPKTPPAPQP